MAYEILSHYEVHFLNGSHYSLFLQLYILPLWLIIELSYFMQMYICSMAKHREITVHGSKNYQIYGHFSVDHIRDVLFVI